MTDPASRAQLEAAIAAQEQLRHTLGDAIVDATIGALWAQLDAAPPPTAVCLHTDHALSPALIPAPV